MQELFRVYLEAAETIRKINADFSEALPYWREHFNTWVFVHNSRDGLGPEVTKRLLDLEKSHLGIAVRPWGF